MKGFFADLHVHTRESSPCGQVPAQEVVRLYLESGYDAIAITDHYMAEVLEGHPGGSFEEKVDYAFLGYRLASEAARGTKLKVFMGMEFRNRESENDFLVYGLSPEFLKSRPDLFDLPLKEGFRLFHEQGALIIQAHPVRMRLMLPQKEGLFNGFGQKAMLTQLRHYPGTPVYPWSQRKACYDAPQSPLFFKVCELMEPESLDGFEAYNGNTNWVQDPLEIEALARRYPKLIRIASSDFHERAHLKKGGVYFTRALETERDMISALREKKIAGYKTDYGVKLP